MGTKLIKKNSKEGKMNTKLFCGQSLLGISQKKFKDPLPEILEPI